ncbi:MAG: FAD-dependent thymidylate synthase [Actinomycetota bacterium]|nr:FAD-dependent thymidylate synthase [Actinomycetota bacterium]MDH5223900.1 FAD-dependent thymidylate synthase [Actinomycetota bacterium]MDH5313688.1 FAD-dependent thymidylate synthase [Actinomycetota bacterium]
MTLAYVTEDFTPSERAMLARHFTNLEGPVFALIDLPEAVKGAMFARYSRTTKSLRRLFLDEFAGDIDEIAGSHAGASSTAGSERAERLYDSVFVEYGDDSVAQLGGVHLACEQSSQLLAKALEWGRLAAYLEQSTRYMRYDDRPGGAWRATVPPELEGTPAGERYAAFLDEAFTTYGRMYEPMEAWFKDRHPQQDGDSDFVYRQTIMAKTCDTLRVLLPAGTRSNLGIYATGQSYEQLLMRLAVHPLAEMREYGELMITELRKVIPEFLKRVDVEERGVAWSRYWQANRERVDALTARVLGEAGVKPEHRGEVTLVDHDPEGETKIAAAVLYASSDVPDDQLLALARSLSREQTAEILRASVGERTNRRHKPGRAWERTSYRFDVLCDYGAFRDLQRHRPLTIEWQRLTTEHGYETPAQIDDAGLRGDWERVMQASADAERALLEAGFGEQAQYAVSMAYRIRFVMQMTAREAMHLTELRSQPAGHPVYRRVAQSMHRLIADVHPAIGETFSYVSDAEVDLERLEAERRTEHKRRALREG